MGELRELIGPPILILFIAQKTANSQNSKSGQILLAINWQALGDDLLSR